jgi:PTS system nitrogen regulatory IIA component
VNSIATLLAPQDICLDVDVPGKAALLDAIGEHMERVHGLSRKWVTLSLQRREQVGSTALGEGVAIPHARVKELDAVRLVFLRLKSPILFDAPDGKPVTTVLALLVPAPAAEEHLRILADAASLFSDRILRRKLLECRDPLEVSRLLAEWSATR